MMGLIKTDKNTDTIFILSTMRQQKQNKSLLPVNN